MADNSVIIQIDAETTKAIRDIASFQRESQKKLESVESAVSGLANGFKFLGVAIASVVSIRALAGFLGEATDEASKSEDAINRMVVALKSSGSFSKSAAKDIEAFASQLQRTTKFSDEAVLQQFALAKTFNLTNERAKELITAATNLASATGVDLDTATRQLGQTLDGTAGKLNESIPAVRGLTAEQLKMGAAIDIVNNRFKGAAEALGGTFGGSIARAKNQFSDMLEVIGGLITQNPVILKGIDLFSRGISNLSKFLSNNSQNITNFVNNIIVGFATSIPKAIGVLGNAFSFLRPIIESVTKIIGFLLLGITGLLKIDVVSGIISFLGKTFLLAAAGALELLNVLNKIPGALGIDTSASQKSIQSLQDKIFGLTDSISTGSVQESLESIGQTITNGIDGTGAAFDGFEKNLVDLQNSAKGISSEFVKASQQQRLAIDHATEGLENQKKALIELGDEAKKQFREQGAKNPLGALFGAKPEGGFSPDAGKAALEKEQFNIGAIVGGVAEASKGAAGALSLVTSSISALVPGLGAAAGQILGVLAQGPEKAKQFFVEFIKQIPVLITNIVEAIPAVIQGIIDALPLLIEALINAIPVIIETLVLAIPNIIDSIITNIPRIIDALISGLPRIINKLVADAPMIISKLIEHLPELITGLINQIPFIITEFVKHLPEVAKLFASGLAAQAPTLAVQFGIALAKEAPRFVEELIKSLNPAKLLGGGGDGLLGLGFLGLSEGGEIPKGYPNDSFPASLTSGELVIPTDKVQKLDMLLSRELNQTRIQNGGPQNIVIQLVVGQQELANVLLDLNRSGFRTA